MKISNNFLFLTILLVLSFSAIAEPPRPPLGKKWVLNHVFSDEFNGTELDKSKWFDYHPTWAGREPGIFLPSQISVRDGLMRIKGEKLAQDKVITSQDIVTEEGTERTYSIAGGAVISKTEDAYFGYYESRFKAAKTTMSTTFWLATRNWDFPGPKECNDRYGLELDIQESIGREGNFDGKIFAKGMHANGHFWYADCDGKMQDLRSPQTTVKTDTFASDGFNTYGGWWHNESSASFYFNNGAPKFMTFYSEIKDKPFDQPMGVNLVSETYPFPWVELPNDEELADPEKNVAYYDWVRAYVLVDAESDQQNSVKDTPEIYAESIHLNTDSATLIGDNKLSFLATYKTNRRRVLRFELKDAQNNVLGTYQVQVNPGYAFLPYQLSFSKPLSRSKEYSITTSIWSVQKANHSEQAVFVQTAQLPNLNTVDNLHPRKHGLTLLEVSAEGSVSLTQKPGVYHFGVFDSQNDIVHQGITYDNLIDVSNLSSGDFTIRLDGIQAAKFTIVK
ncbi:beta-porphyranase D [Agaribacter marinus]|uniref:beta-porphyranase D n=1 Tax=Agaribacter marinus TaxID=1431249 RepID=UPI0024E0BA36|nr:beta-porphyranase D [Agaribacter marinus]